MHETSPAAPFFTLRLVITPTATGWLFCLSEERISVLVTIPVVPLHYAASTRTLK